MSPRAPVTYIDIQVFAHATEDPAKTLTSVCSILPSGLCDQAAFRRSDLKGHHGNPIVLIKTRIKEDSQIKEVLTKLVATLSVLDKERLGRDIDRFAEDGNLYLRFDKQAAYHGKLRLHSVDPVRFKLHFRTSNKGGIVEFCRQCEMIL